MTAEHCSTAVCVEDASILRAGRRVEPKGPILSQHRPTITISAHLPSTMTVDRTMASGPMWIMRCGTMVTALAEASREKQSKTEVEVIVQPGVLCRRAVGPRPAPERRDAGGLTLIGSGPNRRRQPSVNGQPPCGRTVGWVEGGTWPSGAPVKKWRTQLAYTLRGGGGGAVTVGRLRFRCARAAADTRSKRM